MDKNNTIYSSSTSSSSSTRRSLIRQRRDDSSITSDSSHHSGNSTIKRIIRRRRRRRMFQFAVLGLTYLTLTVPSIRAAVIPDAAAAAAAAAVLSPPPPPPPPPQEQEQDSHEQRQLVIGDFASINQVLQSAKFELPPTSGTEDSTTLRLTNIVCQNVNLGDIQLEYTTTSTSNAVDDDDDDLLLEMTIRVMDLDLICNANYDYDGRLLSGQGDVQVTSQNNYVIVQGSIRKDPASTSSSDAPLPSILELNSCTPTVNIQNIDFDNGGFLGWVLNLIEGLARGIMGNLVEDMLCQELQKALTNAQGILDEVNGRLNQYDIVGGGTEVDPLQAERDLPSELKVESGGGIGGANSDEIMASLLDLSSPQTLVGQWVQQTMNQGIDYLRATVEDPSPITTDTTTDLQANIWMRQFLLNEDRGLVLVNASQEADGGGEPMTIFYNHDQLLETTVQVQRVQLLGLDTLTVLDPLSIIGQYTLQSDVSWEYLALEMDATLDIRPSTLDNALVTGQDGLVENVRIVLGLGNVQATMALLAAIHQDILESLQLGSLMSTANLLPCLVSTVVRLKLSSFSVQAGDIYSPYLSGLDSVGLDRVLDDLLEIIFVLYEDVALQRSPAYFQQDFREMLNQDFLQEYLTTTTAATDCPLPTTVPTTNAPAGFVDFRDLLLNPIDAWYRGGVGTEPYGDLFSSMITPNLDAQLGSVEQLNERFIRSATEAQSGVPGALMWPDWVGVDFTTSSSTTDGGGGGGDSSSSSSITSSLYDAAVFHVSDLRIHNLDTVTDPLNLLDAQDWNILFQTLTLESLNSNSENQKPPLNVSASVLFAVGDESSPLAMKNQLDLTLIIPSITVSAAILAHMHTEDLLQFPLVDATNPYCWLATLGSYTSVDPGNGVSTLLAPLVLESLSLSLDTFGLDSECISCTSPGAHVLSELLRDDLPRFGFVDVFAPRFVALAQDIAWHLVEEFDLGSLITEAMMLCPHRSTASSNTGSVVNPGPIGTTVGLMQQQIQRGNGNGGNFTAEDGTMRMVHALSEDSVETALGLGIVALQSVMAIVARNHVMMVEEGTLEAAPSMTTNRTQETYNNNNNKNNVADWTNLSAAGLGEWADFGFDELRKYILAPVKDGRVLQPIETSSSRMMDAVLLETNTIDADADAAGEELEASSSIPRLLSLLQEHVLDESGAYTFDLGGEANAAAMEALGVEIVMTQVQIQGLDSLSQIDVLVPVQPQVLRNQFHLDELTVVVDATINFGGKEEPAAIQFIYSAKNIAAQLDLLVAVDLDSIREIPIGSFFNTSNILACMATGLQDVQIHQLSTTIEAVDGPRLSGFFSSAFQDSMESILSSMAEDYQEMVLSAMPIMLDSTIKDVINALLPELIVSIQKDCAAPPQYSQEGLVDFRNLLLPTNVSRSLGGTGGTPYGDLFQVLYDLLEENVLRSGAMNQPVINDIFRHVTNEQSGINGTFMVEENAFDTQTMFKIAGLEADFGFRISNVALENIDSVGDPLEIFRPMKDQANIVDNILSFGVDSRPVRLAATLLLSLSDGVGMNIRNEMRVSLAVEDVVIMAELLLKISELSFADFPIRDLNNVHCWLATVLAHSSDDDNGPTFRGIGLENQSFTIGNFSFGIDCQDCTSPYFDELILSLYDFENATVLENTIRQQTNGLLEADFLPVLLDQLVDGSSKRCPHHPNFDPNATPVSFLSSPADSLGLFEIASNSDEKSSYFIIVNTVVATLIFLIGILATWIVKKRNRRWIESLSREGAILLERQQEKDRQMQAMLNASTTSLFASPNLPRRIRYGVPVAILINIGLYMGGHFGVLSVVNVDASLAGQEFTIYEFLQFKFFESTRNTYNNGGADMAILLWMFTGVWPYIKLILSLLIWMLPPSRLSVYRRGQALLWIDALAKLSVIDIFTLLLGFAVLLVFIGGPDESLSSSAASSLYVFKAVIIPRAGFYCLIVGQRMSRVSSKYLLENHDRVIDAATKQHDAKSLDSTQESVTDSDLSRGNSGILANVPSVESFNDETSSSSDAGSMMQRIDEVAARVSAEEEDGRSTASFDDRFDDVQSVDEPDIDESLNGDEKVASSDNPDFENRWGTMGVVFGAITIFIIFVIGCVFAPAISLDTSSLAGLAVESDMTYEDIVNEYGVFLVISSVLLKTRFVLDSKADYVGLGFLIVGALVSIACVFFFQAYQFIKRKMKERRAGPVVPSYGHRGCGMPLYLRLHKWKHMEIYLIAVTIGVWQLGSACAYAIHLYCDILQQAYSLMAFVGLADESTAECSRIQATLPGNLIIIGASFLMLLLAFFFQAAAQYKKNIADSLRFVDNDDVPRLSLAWSRDKSKNSRYSHLTASLSVDQLSSESGMSMPSTPCTSTSTTPPSTPRSEESVNMDSDSSQPHHEPCPLSPVYSTPPRSTSFKSQRTSTVRFGFNDDEGCLPPSPPRVHSREMPSVAVDRRDVRLEYRPSHENDSEVF